MAINYTTVGTHTRHAVLDSSTNIIAIHNAEAALHGRLYLADDTIDIYIGNNDGSLSRIGGQSAWVVKGDGVSTLGVSPGATLEIKGIDILNVGVNAGALEISLDAAGAVTGDVLTYNGTNFVWDPIPTAAITEVGDTNTVNLTIAGTTLTADVNISATANNRLEDSGGLYVPPYTAGPGITISAADEISISSLAVSNVIVDTSSGNLSTWHGLPGETSVEEGDVVVLTNATNGRETWIHNGGTTNTTADYTKISDELNAAEVRGYIDPQAPLEFNGSNQLVIKGIIDNGSVGEIVTSNGTSGWTYSSADTIAGNITGAALTKQDDTNVTLTLGANASTGLLRTIDIQVGWSGQLPVSRGGTGVATITGVMIGNGTSPVTGIIGTPNQLIRRNGADTAYEFFTPTYLTANQPITLSGDVTGSGTTSITTTIPANSVDFTQIQTVSTDILLGRDAAGAGNIEEISIGAGLSLSGGTLSATAATDTNSWNVTGGTTKSNGVADVIYHNGAVHINATGSAIVTGAVASVKLGVQGDIHIGDSGALGDTVGDAFGIYMYSPSGTRYKLTVTDDGSLFCV